MTTRAQAQRRPQLGIVIVGHVDHGKSTIVGRILADTGSLPDGKLESVKKSCERNAKPFEYAFLVDALKDEQAQGITIDSSRIFSKSQKRDYVIIDAPGHIEFLKNMISGASRADAAVLVIDAHEGIQENSRRHGYMLSFLGVKQVAVVVNKMDLLSFDEKQFNKIKVEYSKFLTQCGLKAQHFIPAAGVQGVNIAKRSSETKWYSGPSVLEALDAFVEPTSAIDAPLRMPIQDIYKFTDAGDDRRIIAGTIETGSLKKDDQIMLYPSLKKSRVKSIEGFSTSELKKAEAGQATGFTLTEQIYAARGEIVARVGDKSPNVTTRFRASLVWLGAESLRQGREYLLKIGTARVPARIIQISRVIDASSLQTKKITDVIERHDVAEVIIETFKPIAFDLHDDLPLTGRFVLVNKFDIAGGGIIKEALTDSQSWLREKVETRSTHWETSFIGSASRAERYNQRAVLIVVTGTKDSSRKEIAKGLEEKLFNERRFVYYLALGSVLYGVNLDLVENLRDHQEIFRRLAEVANIMLDAGAILIVTAQDLKQIDLEMFKTALGEDRVQTVWTGDADQTDLKFDLNVGQDAGPAIAKIEELLRLRQIIT